MYGIEAQVLLTKEVTTMEHFYRCNIRALQHMSRSTATLAIYLLMGVPPLEAQHHITIIVFFTSALHHHNAMEYTVIQHQLVMKMELAHSWVWHVCNLLKK